MRKYRQLPRYMAEFPAKLVQRSSSTELDVQVTNISIMGCALGGAPSLSPGEDCELKFEREDLQFHAKARVVWKTSKGKIGLRFLEIDEKSLDALRTICSHLQLQPPSTLPLDPS